MRRAFLASFYRVLPCQRVWYHVSSKSGHFQRIPVLPSHPVTLWSLYSLFPKNHENFKITTKLFPMWNGYSSFGTTCAQCIANRILIHLLKRCIQIRILSWHFRMVLLIRLRNFVLHVLRILCWIVLLLLLFLVTRKLLLHFCRHSLSFQYHFHLYIMYIKYSSYSYIAHLHSCFEQ